MVQQVIVGVLVVAAALYTAWALAPARWRRRLAAKAGLAGTRGTPAGGDAGASDGGCGCSACPPARPPRR